MDKPALKDPKKRNWTRFFLFLGLLLLLALSWNLFAETIGQQPQLSHQQDFKKLELETARAEKGATLFQTHGCNACHKVDSARQLSPGTRIGPELLRVSSKLNRQWLVSWIQNPQLVHRRTLMPVYGAKGQGLPYSEAEAIAGYLLSAAADLQLSPQAIAYDHSYKPTAKSIARGKQILESRACLGCHDLGNHKAPGARHISLEGAGLKLAPAWIYNWIQDPKQISPTTIMPKLSLLPDEIRCLSDFIMSLTKPELNYPLLVTESGSPSDVSEFKKLAYKDGCYSCHTFSWLAQNDKRKNLDSILPFTVDQAELFFGPKKASPSDIERGKQLIHRYACYSCHLIPGFEKLPAQCGTELTGFADRDVSLLNWGSKNPEPLENRNCLSWTKLKLKDTQAFDTDRFKALMPNFYLSAAEIDELAAYLKTLSRKPAN